MASVNRVYRILKDLTNKEQKGFITPTVFNNFAYTAQMNIYNEMFTEMVKAKQLKRQGFNPSRDKSLTKQVREDLSYFTREVTVDVDKDGGPSPAGGGIVHSNNSEVRLRPGEVVELTEE